MPLESVLGEEKEKEKEKSMFGLVLVVLIILAFIGVPVLILFLVEGLDSVSAIMESVAVMISRIKVCCLSLLLNSIVSSFHRPPSASHLLSR